MIPTYESPDWQRYLMNYSEPFREFEPLQQEIAIVDEALEVLRRAGILPHTQYDRSKMLTHRKAVRQLFDVPWTAITPRMERLLYALNAIAQPKNLICAGIFCGFTFISNAGAGVGPGACYRPTNLIGVEISAEWAEGAERNLRRIDPSGFARIVRADALEFIKNFAEPIDLLYLDVNGQGKGKALYLDILNAAYGKLSDGAIVLAHNSLNSAQALEDYLDFVRDRSNFRASVNIILDPEGLEVSRK